jgi:hypothetical protein
LKWGERGEGGSLKGEELTSASGLLSAPAALYLTLIFAFYGNGCSENRKNGAETPVQTAARSSALILPTIVEKVEKVQSTPSRAEQVMKAFAVAYPDRAGEAVFRNGDWAIAVYGNWFYYAEGRLLPETLRTRFADYDPQPFYRYLPELPEWKAPDAETAARFKNSAAQRSEHPPKRSQHFYDALWRGSTKDEAYLHVKSIRFLGWSVLVHYSILEELALIEERINAEAAINQQVRQWINNIDSLSGWNWRSIAATESRSFHAYGSAIDIVSKPQRGKETYWLWSSQKNIEWWALPYEQRLHPPDAVIKIFESYGFVWGGKWTLFDTMHFEYRPEIFVLSGLPLNATGPR